MQVRIICTPQQAQPQNGGHSSSQSSSAGCCATEATSSSCSCFHRSSGQGNRLISRIYMLRMFVKIFTGTKLSAVSSSRKIIPVALLHLLKMNTVKTKEVVFITYVAETFFQFTIDLNIYFSFCIYFLYCFRL